jgi:hypothetical protein
LLLFYPPHLGGESGCKDNIISPLPPNFFTTFFKLFFQKPPVKKSSTGQNPEDEKMQLPKSFRTSVSFRKRVQK